MNKNLTEILVVLDRSGSMSSTREDAEGGLNTFIEEQKKGVGEANFTLVQFDENYDVVYDGVPIKNVVPFTLVPRGSTALLDAIGKIVTTAGERFAKMEEKDRPGLVYLKIITDGGENASREYTKSRIRDLLKTQQEVYNWKVDFLGSNQDGFAEGNALGIQSSHTYAGHNTQQVYAASSDKLARMRGQTCSGLEADNSYTEEEVKTFS